MLRLKRQFNHEIVSKKKRNYPQNLQYLKNLPLNLLLKSIDFIQTMYNFKKLNKLKNFLQGIKVNVVFLIEEKSWAIAWIGYYITRYLRELNLIEAEIGSSYFAKSKIIHFGSINCLIGSKNLASLKKSNKHVLTWFHITPDDKRLKYIPLLNKRIDILHVSSLVTKNKLIKYGFDEDKIVVIPLGVDLSHFKKYDDIKRNQLKKKFGLPSNKLIIGSFQKDGVGWEEGMKPKLVKGPDIFCEVVRKLKNKYDIHIFLTGPARGYVKKKLKEYQIPYTHIFLENYLDIVDCYNTLDLYLVTSRAEGGPKALLECMATGVPLVTTNVGMVPYLIKNEINALKTDINNIDELYQYSIDIIKNDDLREKLVNNALKTVKEYSWQKVAIQYYKKIYKRLLDLK